MFAAARCRARREGNRDGRSQFARSRPHSQKSDARRPTPDALRFPPRGGPADGERSARGASASVRSDLEIVAPAVGDAGERDQARRRARGAGDSRGDEAAVDLEWARAARKSRALAHRAALRRRPLAAQRAAGIPRPSSTRAPTRVRTSTTRSLRRTRSVATLAPRRASPSSCACRRRVRRIGCRPNSTRDDRSRSRTPGRRRRRWT